MPIASVTADLSAFPRPNVAVDVAVVTSPPFGPLAVLVHRRSGDRAGQWALPGRFLRERELLAHAVATALAEKCGLSHEILDDRVPRQLHVFDDPQRDDRGWVLSVAHLLALPHTEITRVLGGRSGLALARVVEDRLVLPNRQRRLPYGQDEIVARAILDLRRSYAELPDPEGLIGSEEFTLSQLRGMHLAVLDRPWQSDTFRRHMLPLLEETGDVTTGGPGRPAALYRRARPATRPRSS
ncbi:MAG: NUDIX hydrolase [Actinobacteria bacterium]|nr:NUDIX hydrolase [Actinomycetota bacterium]